MSIDLLISGLLAVTILYCWRLNRKITTLHQDREELLEVLGTFNESVQKAEGHIRELKALGEATDAQLIEHIKKARFIANDLSFLLEKSESVADKLEFYSDNRPPRKHHDGQNAESGASKQRMVRDLLEQIAHYKKEQKAKPSERPKRQARAARQSEEQPAEAAPPEEEAQRPNQHQEPRPFVRMPPNPSRTRQARETMARQEAMQQPSQMVDT